MDDPVFMYTLLMMAGVLINITLCGAVICAVTKLCGGRNPRTTQILKISTALLSGPDKPHWPAR
jgi:hypothetical protein